jgi:hypothetical protein
MHEAPRIQGAFSYTMILPNQMEAVSPAMRFSLTESPGLTAQRIGTRRDRHCSQYYSKGMMALFVCSSFVV